MLLVVDIGNTQTVLGLYDAEQLVTSWRVSTKKHESPDEVRVRLSSLFSISNIALSCVRGVALASVVPQLGIIWEAACGGLFAGKFVHCDAPQALRAGVLKSSYAAPGGIGADRVADAIAAVAQFGAPVIVVDFGTATNIEVVEATGNFIGGIIAPGVETGARALFSQATRLAEVDLYVPPSVVGASTGDAIRAGVVLGEAARVDGLVQAVFDELGYDAPVVATGGFAPLVAQKAQTITAVEPTLTLLGLRLFYEALEALEARECEEA